MRRYQVRITATAEDHIRSIERWRVENMGERAGEFADELDVAFQRLTVLPFSGSPYPARAGIRRLLLRRSQYHLYYTVDEKNQHVFVRAVWHTARGRKPVL